MEQSGQEETKVEHNESDCSSSSDEVIYVERKQEIIELSDDNDDDGKREEGKAEEKLMEKLRRSLVAYRMQDEYNDDVVVELPASVWSLPWEEVRDIYGAPPTDGAKRRKAVPRRRTRPEGPGFSATGQVSAEVCNIKQEKDEQNPRGISVIHFDPNRPPEFCEVSRSGRVIKKPTRLKDDVTFFMRRHNNSKKTGRVKKPSEKTLIHPTQKDNPVTDEFTDNSDCDNVEDAITTADNSDYVQRAVSPLSSVPSVSSFSDDSFDIEIPRDPDMWNDLDATIGKTREFHNANERQRRLAIKFNYHQLLCQIDSVCSDLHDLTNVSKVKILEKALHVILELKSNLELLKSQHKYLRNINVRLIKNVKNLKSAYTVSQLPHPGVTKTEHL